MGEVAKPQIESSVYTDAQLREMLRWWQLRDREDERRRERFRLIAVVAGTATITSLAIALVTVISFELRRPSETTQMIMPTPEAVASSVKAPNLPVRAVAVSPAPADVSSPLTPIERAGAERRVEKLLQEATTMEKRAELQSKQNVANISIQALGYDGARVKAAGTARGLMALANSVKAKKGSASLEFVQAIALVKYWRDISDLIIVATPTSPS